jgi:hypothetical protein
MAIICTPRLRTDGAHKNKYQWIAAPGGLKVGTALCYHVHHGGLDADVGKQEPLLLNTFQTWLNLIVFVRLWHICRFILDLKYTTPYWRPHFIPQAISTGRCFFRPPLIYRSWTMPRCAQCHCPVRRFNMSFVRHGLGLWLGPIVSGLKHILILLLTCLQSFTRIGFAMVHRHRPHTITSLSTCPAPQDCLFCAKV